MKRRRMKMKKKKSLKKNLKNKKQDKETYRKNLVLLTELNRIKNYFVLLETDTLVEYLNQKELSSLINEKIISIENTLEKNRNLKQLKDSISKFFITLNKVEMTLAEREEFVFELLKDKQVCLSNINLLIKEIKENMKKFCASTKTQ